MPLRRPVDEPGRPHDREVLARVGECHADRRRELAHGPLPAPQGVEQHEPLGVGQDLADLGVQAVELQRVVGVIHGYLVSRRGDVRPRLREHGIR